MTMEKQICRAIQEKRAMIYTCDRGDSVLGERIGNPHIVFCTTRHLHMVHIWKTGGVETDMDLPIPGWRLYYLEHLAVEKILDETFTVEDTFNPDYRMYDDIKCMVS